MRNIVTAIGLAVILGGCSGTIHVVVPDAVGPAAGAAPVTIGLERQEFWFWYMPMKQQVLTAQVAGEPLRGAFTNDQGAAALLAPLPDKPGVYPVDIQFQDDHGGEHGQSAAAYVMDPRQLGLAVDMEALDIGSSGSTRPSAEAMTKLARAGVQIVYLSEDRSNAPQPAHAWLAGHGYPDGPVLPWEWHEGGTPHVSGSLPAARKQLPGLMLGIPAEADDVGAFTQLEMIPIALAPVRSKDAVEMAGWDDLAARILARQGQLLGLRDFQALTPQTIRQILQAGQP